MLNELLEHIYYKMHVFPLVGIELEFYFENVENNQILPVIINRIKDDLENKLNSISVNIVKENGDLQYEVQTSCHTDIISLVNNVNFIKEIIVKSAEVFGVKVNFLSKPDIAKPGSALHIHINLLDKLNNNLYFFSSQHQMSRYLRYSIGGACTYMKKHMIYFAPHENSYLRYQYADIDTPTTVSWGGNNRTTAIRIPNFTGNVSACRIEHRVAGADANCEQVILAVLSGITYGIQYRIDPPNMIHGIASDDQYGLEKLPLTIDEAKKYNGEEL